MKDFDHIIKDKLYDYQVTPPAELFDSVRKNYPKRTLVEKINDKKIYIIASLFIILITGVVLFTYDNSSLNHVEKSEDNNITANKDVDFVYENSNENKIDNENDPNINTEEPLIINTDRDNSNFKNIEIFVADIFDVIDTVICGEVYDNKYIKNVDNIILPDNITLIKNDNNLSFVSSKPGKYFIKYYEEQDNKIFIDSMYIQYNKIRLPDVTVSSDVLCYNEDLYITVIDNNLYSNWKWEIENAKIQSLTKNKYKITGLNSGINKLAWSFNIGGCALTQEKNIRVKDKFEYGIDIKPNYCAGLNASITIRPKNYAPEYYILDNNNINKTGIFDSLNSGIHMMKINYGDDCYVYDTLFIMDSLNLNPFFTSEKDLISDNKYNFRNHTKIDNIGYEKNNNVKFLWKVNNLEFSVMDNPSYEFNRSGLYTVELIAMLNENCMGTYSENIVISDLELKIPNAFTPNGDGIGDKFEIYYEEELVSFKIIITSRVGEKVFESDDINVSWDGKIFGNNDAPDGYYSYKITGIDKKGNAIDQAGFIQLIRR